LPFHPGCQMLRAVKLVQDALFARVRALCLQTRCERSGVRLLVFLKGTWAFYPGGGQTGKLYASEKQKNHQGRPFQPAYHSWSVPTKKCGYLEVNLSVSLTLPRV